MARSVALLFLAILLTSTARSIASELSCGQVVSFVTPCIEYTQGAGALTPGCCSGVRGLHGATGTTTDRQTACNCLKSASSQIPGIKVGLISGLPGKCGVSFPYTITPSADCSNVH